eukprot:scaffold236340_cov15-Tisochrysis_lutea.AAC.2
MHLSILVDYIQQQEECCAKIIPSIVHAQSWLGETTKNTHCSHKKIPNASSSPGTSTPAHRDDLPLCLLNAMDV